ncbi:MAG: recombinase family protein [Micromonosporaceae bacterium]
MDQERRIRKHGKQLGWNVTRVIVENDLVSSRDGKKKRGVSAFKRRKVTLPDGRSEWRVFRPGFRLSLDLLAKGEYDGFIALDLDRAVRDPRDLEDLIDVVEEHRVPVQSVTGSLRLANDADITMARVMVAVANKESRDKARRVAASRERRALAGEFAGGVRPYGFEPDGVTVRPAEADVVADCTTRLLQGASLRSLALELRERGVPAASGGAWSASTLRSILLRARNAGRMVYRGEEIGDAPWEPIVKLELFRDVQRLLTNPQRRDGPGPAAKWLGTNLYLCGICTDEALTHLVHVHVKAGGREPRYRCKENGHLARAVHYVDRYVTGAVLARLAEPDAADLLVPAKPEVDVAGLRAEAKAIRNNLNDLAADKAMGLIDRAQLLAGTTAGKARLNEIETQLRDATVDSPLAPLLDAEDIKAAWDALGLAHQRLVVAALVTVRILPGRRGRGFDPATVAITWNDQPR